jgi:hypothetical protein
MKCAASLGGTIDILLSRHRLSTHAARRFRRPLIGFSPVLDPYFRPVELARAQNSNQSEEAQSFFAD